MPLSQRCLQQTPLSLMLYAASLLVVFVKLVCPKYCVPQIRDRNLTASYKTQKFLPFFYGVVY
jgi:hypothetical protein